MGKTAADKPEAIGVSVSNNGHSGTKTPPGASSKTARWKNTALALVLVALVVAGGVALWRAGLLRTLSNRGRVINLLRTAGVKGPIVCIAAQFAQVVIFAIPGEITQFAAGYVFGSWRGFLYSIIGIMLGSAFNFLFGRVVGRPTLEKLIGTTTLAKVDTLLNSAKGKSAVFLLFLIPGTPKDAMCYGAGLCRLNLVEFIVITGLARSPALFASILLGAQASRRDYDAMVLTGIVAGAAILSYYIYERRRSQKSAAKRGAGSLGQWS